MDILGMLKGMFGKQANSAVAGVTDNLKNKADDMIDSLAQTVKEQTPDMLDVFVDQAAQQAKETVESVNTDNLVDTVIDSQNK